MSWSLALLALSGCTGEADDTALPACPSPMNAGWDPVLEPDRRADAAGVTWESDGPTVSTDADTACADASCLRVSGAGRIRTVVPLNRGVEHVLSFDLTGTANVDVRLVRDDARVPLASATATGGPFTLSFTPEAANDGVEITLDVTSTDARFDGFAVDTTQWAWADAPAEDTLVHVGFVVHIEEDGAFKTSEATWRARATFVERLSTRLVARGAALTLQPDASFVEGAARWDPDWAAARTAEGMGWSTHEHVTDAQDFSQKIRNARTAFDAVGVKVRDLNSGFEVGAWDVARDAGYTSLSALKIAETQRGLSRGFTTPWRPPADATAGDEASFTVHDPDGPIVFLPSPDTREADHARFAERIGRAFSQTRAHARPGFINTFYVVDHVDDYRPEASDLTSLEAYLTDGRLDADLAGYEEVLDALQPRVDAGTVRYVTVPAMAEAYLRWSDACEE